MQLEVVQNNGDSAPITTHIRVTDTGVGIRSEDVPRLFQAFTRFNVEKQREGTGLALHLSQRLAELIGGQITLESDYGKGSRFTLVLADSPKSQA